MTASLRASLERLRQCCESEGKVDIKIEDLVLADENDILAALEAIEQDGERNEITGEMLAVAWRRYRQCFGISPRGTAKQLGALLTLVVPAPPSQEDAK